MVKMLTCPLVGKHPHVFMGNFFTSPALFLNLVGYGIYACGTVRSNRKGFPEDLKRKKILKNRCATLCTYSHIYSIVIV